MTIGNRIMILVVTRCSKKPSSSNGMKNNAKEFALLLGSLGVNLGNKLVISLQLLC